MSEIPVLWTGGWDSTFRVLDLLINHQVCVRPYYLIDRDRAASNVEIATMEKIAGRVAQEFPDTAARLFPLEVFSRDDLPEINEITSAYQSLAARQHIGSQYDWLARFCHARGIEGIELSIDKDIKQRHVVSGARAALAASAVPFEGPAGVSYRVSPDLCDSDQYKVFRYFTFPLFDTTKVEMKERAAAAGFLPILEQSWFCHFPRKSLPCGRCPPCRSTIEKGMGYRLPYTSRFVYYPLRKLEGWVESVFSTGTVRRLKALKSGLTP